MLPCIVQLYNPFKEFRLYLILMGSYIKGVRFRLQDIVFYDGELQDIGGLGFRVQDIRTGSFKTYRV